MLAMVLAAVSGVLSLVVLGLWRKVRTAQTAESARAVAEAKFAQLEEDYARTRHALEAGEKARERAERAEALALQKVEAAEQRLKDFEALKTQFEQYAKAAALETGNQLSSKLMADHLRAREDTHKQFEQFTKTASEQLLAKQQELANTLGKVQGQMHDSRTQLATLVRAMQNPIGAGAEGEIVMGNILEQHGFRAGVDYDLQVHLAGEEGNLRPDCVIYLPHTHAVIIDSKASQHIYALFRSEGTPEFEENFREIQTTMRAHAKALASKSYQEQFKKLKNHGGEAMTRTTLVMFIPNDEVVTRLSHKDPNLMQFMREHDLLLAGPTTLSGLFLVARALIHEARQLDAQHAIVELTGELMTDLITALSHAEDVMKGVRTSAAAYDKFAASLNRGVMARLKKLAAKGVKPAKNKSLPGALQRYEITRVDEIIQGEAEEISTVLALGKEDAA
jgi:DNA recombination protein RmuC